MPEIKLNDEYVATYHRDNRDIVEQILTEIDAGNITSYDEAQVWMDDTLSQNEWVEHHPVETLLISPHACLGFDYEYAPDFVRHVGQIDGGESEHGQALRKSLLKPGAEFPFTAFAAIAKREDVRVLLDQEQRVQQLKVNV